MGPVIYLKNSYKDKNIASIFFLVNILAFCINTKDFLLVLIRNEYIMKLIEFTFLN